MPRPSSHDRAGGILTRLRRDVRGNTLAIMAAAMVPIVGFAGAAIDMGRLYVVKVRLQQACDAGVLAGRKTMTDNSLATPLDATATTQARAFFNNNFRAGWYQTQNVTFTPVKATSNTTSTIANAVTGTAHATVPLAIMQFFKLAPVPLNVACQAVFDLADTDVMFVLDTTGSMSCYPSDPANCANGPVQAYSRSDGTTGYYQPEKSPSVSGGTTTYSKLESLRQSVTLFDTTIRATADPTTQFRYGFVPYSSAVNIGYDIPSGYLQNTTHVYQSRHLAPDRPNVVNALAGDYAYGWPSSFSLTNVPQSYCQSQRYPATGFAQNGYNWSNSYYQARSYYNLSWKSWNGGTCSGTQQILRPKWRYEPVTYDISQWAAGNSVADPSRLGGASRRWRGCVEEVNTTTASSFSVNSLPDDLNPNFKPTSDSDKWRPQWPEVEWLRPPASGAGAAPYADVLDENVNEANPYYWTDYGYRQDGVFDKNGSAACGMRAQRLRAMTSVQVHDYLYDADFKAFGGTYHDVGMIWGTRMLSPGGVFASDTAAQPGRPDPSRNIVFVTDGTMSPGQTIYGQYGVEQIENRTGGANDSTQDYNNHTARFRVECDAAKKLGITIYVVAVGTGITDDLTYCASPGQTFQASSTSALQQAFQNIAKRIAQLRITQ